LTEKARSNLRKCLFQLVSYKMLNHFDLRRVSRYNK
jgi:hypothetical protein